MNGGKAMRNRQCQRSRMLVVLLAVAAMVLIMVPTKAWAPPPKCSNFRSSVYDPAADECDDYDGDGWTDAMECLGITYINGDVINGENNCTQQDGRANCLGPRVMDVFYTLSPAETSYIPVDVLEYYQKMGIYAHLPEPGQVSLSRNVISGWPAQCSPEQKALRLAENDDPTPGIQQGECGVGPIWQAGRCEVWTQRIHDLVWRECGLTIPPLTNGCIFEVYAGRRTLLETFEDPATGQDIMMIKTFSHEAGHSASLGHIKQDKYLMETHVVYKNDENTNITTFYVGGDWSSSSTRDFAAY
jgi:hypothetical protein